MVGHALQKSGADMVKLGYFMTKIQSSDLYLIKKVDLLTRSRQEKENKLREMYSTREKLDASLLSEEEKESSLLAEQEQAHSEISRKRRMLESARDKLKREYEKIETILVSLTNSSSRKLIERPSTQGSFQVGGEGLARYSRWPVEGKVVHKYGQYRVSTFQDVVFHKGVLFDVLSGTPVRALEKGIVRFIGIMPKYGLVLLLDHGRREYTLYGKLSEARVSVGSEVPQDQILGSAGQKGKDEEGSFYFEIRRGGKPVDPDKYVMNDLKSRS
jgi:septal ring factor EnvC (AmiA/AmiB activator)